MILFQKEYNQDIDRQNVNPRSLIPKLEEELGEVRRILMDAVQKLIDRGEKMDELVRKTQSLEISVTRVTHIFFFVLNSDELMYTPHI